jgi:hypothetical protein
MLQIAMETLNLVILTMFDPSEYRAIVEEALEEIKMGIGVELVGNTEMKAALLLFLGLTTGDRVVRRTSLSSTPPPLPPLATNAC